MTVRDNKRVHKVREKFLSSHPSCEEEFDSAFEEALFKARIEALQEARRVISIHLQTTEPWRSERIKWAFGIMLGEIPENTPEPSHR